MHSLTNKISNGMKVQQVNPVRNTKALSRKNKISNGLKITIRNLQKNIPLNPRRIKSAVLKVLSLERIKNPGEITILFVNDKQIRKLNFRYRGCDRPTDVLSFDNSTNKKEILSDIIVSCQTAMRNARYFKTTPLYEIYLYVIHGILHVLGYDDKTLKQRRIMEAKSLEYTQCTKNEG